MFMQRIEFRDDSYISEIVTEDYRTSTVFLKYGIDYCCSAKNPLWEVCESHGLNLETVKQELSEAVRNLNVSNSLDFNLWDIDFLIDYIEYVHHHYLRENLCVIDDMLAKLVQSNGSEHPYLHELHDYFRGLQSDLLPHLREEENIIFPYIKQIAHAYTRQEAYAGLFVRTLRKPVENIMHQEEERLSQYLHRFRKLTNNYTPPNHGSVAHKVCFSKLKELDNDLAQHIHLENNILFPKAIAMEQEMLRKN
jgi:regulator of cell morphogenesis and NO signaling